MENCVEVLENKAEEIFQRSQKEKRLQFREAVYEIQ